MAMAACTTRQVNSCFAPFFAVGSSTLTIGHQHGRRLASQASRQSSVMMSRMLEQANSIYRTAIGRFSRYLIPHKILQFPSAP